MNQETKDVPRPERESRVLREALAEARQVLKDWLVTHAAEHCYQDQVDEALERFRQRGGKINCTAEVTANITEILGDSEHERNEVA